MAYAKVLEYGFSFSVILKALVPVHTFKIYTKNLNIRHILKTKPKNK